MSQNPHPFLRSYRTASAIGIKLISTFWTDQHLQDVEGITAEQLRQEPRS